MTVDKSRQDHPPAQFAAHTNNYRALIHNPCVWASMGRCLTRIPLSTPSPAPMTTTT